MDRKECYRLTHPLSKISGYATGSSEFLCAVDATDNWRRQLDDGRRVFLRGLCQPRQSGGASDTRQPARVLRAGSLLRQPRRPGAGPCRATLSTRPFCADMTSSMKPEVHNVSQRHPETRT